MQRRLYKPSDFYFLNIKLILGFIKTQHFSFWMICAYLIFEFVRPQALYPAISGIPWAKLFIILSLVGALADPSVKWVSSPTNKWMVLFLVSILASTYFAYDSEVSKHFFMNFFGWFVIYFLIINIVNTKERFYIFLVILILAAGKIAIGTTKVWVMRGFTYTSWGLMGPEGFFQNSGELAILMLVLFPLVYYIYVAIRTNIRLWERVLLIAFCVCSVMTIAGSSSRGSQLALVLMLAFMFRRQIFKPKSMIGIVIVFSALYFLLPDEQKTRFSSAGEDKTSQQRLLYWKNGWEMMKSHPYLGIGYYNFIPYYERYHSEDMLYPRAELPHNIFIQVGTDCGFIGLTFFIFIILQCFLMCRKIVNNKRVEELWKNVAIGLAYGVFGFVLAGQFVTVTYYPFLWISLAYIVCLYKITASAEVVERVKDFGCEN